MARVRYEHGFQWDLFISYSWQDNQTPEKWVEAFQARLQNRLDEITGKDVRIWRDAGKIGPGGVLDSSVTAAVENSAIFLMVLSPNWLASDWCPREHTLFQTAGKQAVANRSRVVTAERYPVAQYPAGVPETLISRFFVKLADETPVHMSVNAALKPGDIFEQPFGSLAGNLAETLRELERNPIRRPGPQEGAVWFAPVAAALTDKLESLKTQAIQGGFEVTPDRTAAKLEVRLVGGGEPREDPGEPRPRLAYVDPEAKDDGLGSQLTREQAGRDGLEVLTNWTEFQERLMLRLKRREEGGEALVPARQGASIYFLHDAPDETRAQELSGHLAAAGCAVQPQWATSTRERTQQNKTWMERSDAILVLLGKCSSDWASIQLRHLVQFGANAKHKSLYLDDPESAPKNMLKGRPDLQVLDGLAGADARLLIRRFLERLPERRP